MDTLRTLQEKLTKFIIDNPELIDIPVYMSTDDEGNGFYPLSIALNKCHVFNPESYYVEVITNEEDIKEEGLEINGILI